MNELRLVLDISEVLFLLFLAWCVWLDRRQNKYIEECKIVQYNTNQKNELLEALVMAYKILSREGSGNYAAAEHIKMVLKDYQSVEENK